VREREKKNVFLHVRQYATRIEERKTVNGRRENERGRVHSHRHNHPHFPPSTIQHPRSAPRYLSIFSHFLLFSCTSPVLSVVSSRVPTPRVISRPPLRCLTTHREKLIRGTMARWAFRSFWMFDVIFPLRFLVVRSLSNGFFLQKTIVVKEKLSKDERHKYLSASWAR